MMILWGHGNCGGIPRLHSYDDAKAHFEKVVPLRGRNEQVKPLGKNRRYTWYRIDKNTIANQFENTEYNTYVCKLYGKDTVTFFPNGDIQINTTGWRDITTGMFINSILNGLGNMVSHNGKWFFSNTKNKHFRFMKDMRLTKDAEGVYTPTEIIVDEKHSINRKAMNAIRNKYKTIIDYGKTMLALEPKFTNVEQLELTKNGLHNYRFLPYNAWESKDITNNRAKWFEIADKQLQSGDLELLYDLARYVAQCAGSYNYREETYACQPNWFVNCIDEMIKYHFRDEIFTTEKLAVGECCTDRNKKYFYLKSY